MFEVSLDIATADEMLQNHGLQAGGDAQLFMTNEIMRLSDSYVPMRSTVLKNSARISAGGDAIIYNTPYARYHWHGKVMVDPKTHKACYKFIDKSTGNVVLYSRRGVQKILTDRDMVYHGGLRGPRWVERCWIDNKQAICLSLEKFINRNK